MKVALYVRVSTEEQRKHGLSVDNQIEALTKYAEDKAYEVVSLYNDAGHSARKKYNTRPELLRLIHDCELGKIDLILFTKLDRWFRNVADYHEVQSILDRYHVKWQAIWEDYETITSSGVFKVNIMLSVAQNEADKTSERIKESIAYRKSKGFFLGHTVPVGYKLKDHTWVIDEEAKPGLDAFFESLIKYGSHRKALIAAKDKGLTLGASQAYHIRHSKYYAGVNNFPTEPYITMEQFEKIQPKRQSTITKREYIFAKVLYCHCGRVLTGQQVEYASKKKGTYSRITYCCHKYKEYVDQQMHSPITVRESYVEQYLLDHLDKIVQNGNYALTDTNINPIEIAKQETKLKEKLKRIGDRYEDGDISRAEYSHKRQVVLDQIAALPKVSKPTKIINLDPNWKEIYSSLDILRKNMFWKSICRKIVVNEDKSLTVFLLN